MYIIKTFLSKKIEKNKSHGNLDGFKKKDLINEKSNNICYRNW